MSPTIDIHQLEREGWLWSGSRSGETRVGGWVGLWARGARGRLQASAAPGPSRAPSGRVDTQDFPPALN